jgi:hypothetical protein
MAGSEPLISSAGSALLSATARSSGLVRALRVELAPWRLARSVHDPAEVLLDLALTVALGGDCLADIALLRAQPEIAGPVASDATVSRTLARLGAQAPAVLAAIDRARAAARAKVWALAPGTALPPTVVVDLDATLIDAHSEKQSATPTFKNGFGFHPLLSFADHGPAGTGEPLALMLRPGNANANTAADQIAIIDAALAQLPPGRRAHTVIRGDTGMGVQKVLHHITSLNLHYSSGFYARQPVVDALAALPEAAWEPAINADGQAREHADVAELTAHMPATLVGWPPDMRIIARRELAHPGAQLRLTDINGWRITTFATNTPTTDGWTISELEARHRLRARAEDRIRALKDTGARNLPLHDFDTNQIWLAITALATELLIWTQLLAWPDQPARRWEPATLRLRVLHVAARLIRTGRREHLRLPRGWPWAQLMLHADQQLAAL